MTPVDTKEKLYERCLSILGELSVYALDQAETMLVEIRSMDIPGGLQPLPPESTPCLPPTETPSTSARGTSTPG
jgi:hypothetical protein